ncbi:hypothetical protein G7Y89_g14107 [Cudoniella acicularis]|uniref:Uncharacterized protein n=1 Tax=Cudoniella acicularis TaxID=354080 RepID=A0A8H4R5Z3_9HELO|nr:hypothetical protein G7Y89_g14107 [Cudoniella acicularis]
MSFGFSIGDFVAAAQVAHQIYNDIYLVARGAPEALQLLNSEIGMLALSLDLMIEEIKNPGSPLVLAGEKRSQMVNEIIKQTNSTLKDLELFAKRYDFNKRNGQSRARRAWDRAKWALEAKSVDGLRAQITRHNGSMNLLLTSAGNSSLERIEKISNKMLSNNVSIQTMIHSLPSTPLLSGIDEKASQIALTEAFMREANRIKPWYITGFNDWLNGARTVIPAQAYTNLLKASFILIDIFPQHPQRRLWADEYLQVELFAEEMKQELVTTEQLGLLKPNPQEILASDLRFWSEVPPTIDLVPVARQHASFQGPGSWCAQVNEEILWRGFGLFATPEQQAFEECIFLVLRSRDLKEVRILGQSQRGLCLMTTGISLGSISQNENLLLCTEPIGTKVGHSIKIDRYTITTTNPIDHLSLSAIFRGIAVYQNFSGFGNSLSSLIILFAIATSCQAVLKQVTHYINDFQSIKKETSDYPKEGIFMGVRKLLMHLEVSNTILFLDETTKEKLTTKGSGPKPKPLSPIQLEMKLKLISKNVDCPFLRIVGACAMIFDDLKLLDDLSTSGGFSSNELLEPEILYEFLPMMPPGFYHDTSRKSHDNKQVLNCLDISAWCGSTNLLRRLLKSEKGSNATPRLLRSFHLAVSNGHEGATKLFLEGGMNPNDRLENDWNSSESSIYEIDGPEVAYRLRTSALKLATKKCHVKIVKLLLDYGADPNHRYGFDGLNLLHICASRPIYSSHDIEAMTRLLAKAKFPIHSPTLLRCGDLPLHLAAFSLNLGAVAGLLKEGANSNAANSQKETALHAYVRGIHERERDAPDPQEHDALIDILRSYFADLEAQDEMGWTPLEQAIPQEWQSAYGADIYAQTLISKGAAIDGGSKEGQGWSPLVFAVYLGNLEMASFLIQKGAKVNSAPLGPARRPGGSRCAILRYFTVLDLIFYKHDTKVVKPLIFQRQPTVDARFVNLLIEYGFVVPNRIKRTCQKIREVRCHDPGSRDGSRDQFISSVV